MDITELLNQANPTMSAALRKRQGMGDLGMLTGDPVLTQLGSQLGDSARSEAWQNTQTEMNRRNVLSRALENESERTWRGDQEKTQREFMAEQNRLNRGLQMSVAKLRAQNQGGLTYKDMSRQLTSLGKQYSGSGIPELDSALQAVEGVATKYEGNLPGIGATGILPGGLLSQGGRDVRQKVAQLRNILLKTRSGSAVTDQEFQRFAEELGAYMGASDRQLMEALPQIRSTMEAGKRAILAGYDPDVADYYEARMNGDDEPAADSDDPFAEMSDEELRAIADGDG